MTHAELIGSIHDSGRSLQEMTPKENGQALDIIAGAIFAGKVTVGHANTLLSIRHANMTDQERKAERLRLGQQ